MNTEPAFVFAVAISLLGVALFKFGQELYGLASAKLIIIDKQLAEARD